MLNNMSEAQVTYLLFFTLSSTRLVLAGVIAAISSLVAVRWSIDAARRKKVLALPGRRMSHTIPTPRLGGIGIAVGILMVLFFAPTWIPIRPSLWLAALLVGGGLAFGGGILDDILDLPPRFKALFQMGAAACVAVAGVWPREIALSPALIAQLGPLWGPALNSALGALFAFAFVMFVMNAVNFMDGMDGHAAQYGMFVAFAMLFLWMLQTLVYITAEHLVLAGLLGGLIGLNHYNHPGRKGPQKTFMGDCGSQFIGFVLAVLMLRARQAQIDDKLPLTVLFILLLPFAWDVAYTIIRRAALRENLFQAHRSHLYQRLLVCGWSHASSLHTSRLVWLGIFLLAISHHILVDNYGAAGSELALLGAVLIMVLYTLRVLLVERRCAQTNGAPQ